MHPAPLIFVHLSDLHVGVSAEDRVGGADTAGNLVRVLDAIRRMEARPAFVVITGDLTGRGETEQYRHLKSLLAEADAGLPMLLVIGNEDDRRNFREVLLEEPQPAEGPYFHSRVVEGLKVIALDSKVPGEQWGDLDQVQLDWLDAELSQPGELGSIVVMHHPVLPRSASEPPAFAWSYYFRGAEKLAPLVRNRPGLLGILSGHYHQMNIGVFQGVLAATAASTSYLTDPSFCDGARWSEGPSFNFCTVRDGHLVVTPVVLPGSQPELGRSKFADRADYQQRMQDFQAVSEAASNAA